MSDVKQETAKADVTLPTQSTNEFLKDAEKAKIELETRINLRQEYEQLYEIWKNNDLIALEKKQTEIIQTGLKTYYEDWKKDQKPPEPEDIQQLLDQEYETFTLPVNIFNDDETISKRTFVIRELPQGIEKKFYRQFKTNLLGKISDLEALVQSEMDTTFESKVKAGLELFDESFDVMADAVVMILNPYGKKDEINREWVQNNISSDRMWRIIEAQMKVNRLRDFFSKVSTSSQNIQMMKRPNFQALQQLAV